MWEEVVSNLIKCIWALPWNMSTVWDKIQSEKKKSHKATEWNPEYYYKWVYKQK